MSPACNSKRNFQVLPMRNVNNNICDNCNNINDNNKNDKWFMNLTENYIPQHIQDIVRLGQNFNFLHAIRVRALIFKYLKIWTVILKMCLMNPISYVVS